MRKFLLYRFLIAGACLVTLTGAARPATKDLQDTFPVSFGTWKATTTPIKLLPAEERAAVFSEAGLKDSFSRPYSDGALSVSVTLQVFGDPTGAFEAYTFSLDPAMHLSADGGLTATRDGRLLMLVGNVLVEVSKPEQVSRKDLQELVSQVKRFADPTPLPPIRIYLPKVGLADSSERYALGTVGFRAALANLNQGSISGLTDAAGFLSGAEAMLARYSVQGKDGGILVLLEYPTPQLAEQHIHHLDELLPATAKQSGTVIERKGSLVSMVLSPSSAAYAKKLRASVDYQTQVTWNEASQTATDPPITSTLVKIIMATGVFMVAAIVLGIAFGGVRIVTKRLFPGKVFDRPNQMEVLQLGLSDKRIDPSDFY